MKKEECKNKAPQPKWEEELKQDLIGIRNGGYITPVVEKIRQLREDAIQEGYNRGRLKCLEQGGCYEALEQQKEEIFKNLEKVIEEEYGEGKEITDRIISHFRNLKLI